LGDYRRAIELLTQALTIFREIGNREGEASALGGLGDSHASLGEYREAIELYSQALTIFREIGNREGEASALGGLGDSQANLGEYREAIELYSQALTICRETHDRYGEAFALDYLGLSWLASGDAMQALTLLAQAVSVADSTGDIEPRVEARSGLARAQLQSGDPAAALATARAALNWSYASGEPTLRLIEAIALLHLDRTAEGAQAFDRATRTAETLLQLADRNVAALQAQALAFSGLAAATADTTMARKAATAFDRSRTVTSAAGVIATSLDLLDQIGSCDPTGFSPTFVPPKSCKSAWACFLPPCGELGRAQLL
jgi:hypothetical protein